MGMSRKEFTLAIVEKIQENPRAVFAGHGMNPAVLQELVKRPDVMEKLAVALWSTKYFKKGAAGLKKQANFAIKGYKNFGEFTMKSREDIETFIGGLSPEDSAAFNNSENVLGILMLADFKQSTGEGETLADEIISGKSVPFTFDQAVRKEYSRTGGMYLTVMFGDSSARPAEVAKAERTEKVNKKKSNRRTPARIIAELKAKANKKLAKLAGIRSELDDAAFAAGAELEQFANIGNEFGVKGGNPINVMGAINKRNAFADSQNLGIATRNAQATTRNAQLAARNATLKGSAANLSDEDKRLYALVKKYKAAGKNSLANALLKEINNPDVTEFTRKGLGKPSGFESPVASGSQMVAGRGQAVKAEIRRLTTKNEELLVDLALAPAENLKRSIKSSISKNTSAIRTLRAKLGTYKNIGVVGMRNKANMLKEVNAAIESNIAEGASIREALENAIATINASPAQKQIIKQQVIAQVVSGMPMQYAVQQTLQEQDFTGENPDLSGNDSIQDIISAL